MLDVQDGMVAVATGEPANVTRWIAALRNASIAYVLAKSQSKGSEGLGARQEIWVKKEDVQRARQIIQNDSPADKPLMW